MLCAPKTPRRAGVTSVGAACKLLQELFGCGPVLSKLAGVVWALSSRRAVLVAKIMCLCSFPEFRQHSAACGASFTEQGGAIFLAPVVGEEFQEGNPTFSEQFSGHNWWQWGRWCA
jgi:hypothetical protein